MKKIFLSIVLASIISLNSNLVAYSNEITVIELHNKRLDNLLDQEQVISNEITVIELHNKRLDNLLDQEQVISIEDQFQNAFDLLREQKFYEAKNSLEIFIDKNPKHKLSGSAHYWLGEIYLLKNKYREAALVLAEGYQKFPKSIKAPNSLYKLAYSLIHIDKVDDACKTLSKIKNDFYSSHRIITSSNELYKKFCEQTNVENSTVVVKLKPKKDKTISTATKQTIIVKNDTTGSEIKVAKSFKANQDLIAIIKGTVTDDSEIVLVSIDGDPISLNKGKFSSSIYVRPKGQMVEIIAMDKKGNKTRTEVNVKRSAAVIATKKFDFLNSTKIKSKLKPNSVALIIGVEDYKKTVSAPFAVNDALNFNDFAHSSLGVPKYHIKLLLNEDAARNNTLDVLATWLPRVVDEKKTDIYVFFSGHGLASEDGSDLYLLPSDGVPEILEDSSLLRNKIFNSIAKLNPKSVTVFLDTCYSGATRSEEMLVAAKPIFNVVEEQEIPNNFTVFSASASKETAKVLKEAEHGLFSYFLMKGLEGQADKNDDHQITNEELHFFINKNVSRQANQTPQLNGNPNQVLVRW